MCRFSSHVRLHSMEMSPMAGYAALVSFWLPVVLTMRTHYDFHEVEKHNCTCHVCDGIFRMGLSVVVDSMQMAPALVSAS